MAKIGLEEEERAHCDGKPGCFGSHLHPSPVALEVLPTMDPILLCRTFREQDMPPIANLSRLCRNKGALRIGNWS